MRRLGKLLGVVACTALYASPHAWLVAQTPVEQSASANENRPAERRDTEQLLLRRIDFDVVHASRKAAVEAAARLAKVLVQYHAEALDAYGPVTIHMEHATLGAVLDRILSGTELNVVGDGSMRLAIVGHPRPAAAHTDETGTIRGVVVDSAKGRAIIGATVAVSGTRISQISGEGGAFVLRNVPSGNVVITAHYVGYHPVTRHVLVTAGDTASVRITLTQNATVLTGVITTATGRQERVAIGADVTKLNVDSIMQVAPIHSMTDLLETRVPGLTAVHTSGAPGDPTRIRLRGVSSLFANNDPIVIVDGIRVYAAQSDARNANLASTAGNPTYAAPSPLDQIDPNTLETVEVFKGPSATALYGSDAGNGVIVITTKRGKAGKTQWNVALNQGLAYIPGQYPLGAYRYGTPPGGTSQICNRVSSFPGIIPSCENADSTVFFQALNDPNLTPLGRGSDSRASTTISGGSSTVQYSFTGSASTTTGVLKLPDFLREGYIRTNGVDAPSWMRRPDKYKTWGVDGSTTTQFATTGRIAVTGSIHKGDQQRSSLETVLGMFEQEAPGLIGDTATLSQFYQKVTDDNVTFSTAASMNWQPYQWLPLSATVGLSNANRTDESLVPFGSPQDSSGQYRLGLGETRQTTANMGTELPLSLQGRRVVTLAIGFNSTTQFTNDATIQTDALSAGVSSPIDFIEDSTHVTHSTFDGTTYGWYGEPRFNFGSRLFVTPGFRFDGGSATGSRAGLTAFPKVDVSYIMLDRQSEAPLFGVLSFLRPRIAVGTAGVQPGPAEHLRLLKTVADTINGVSVPGLGLGSSYGNTQLRPERSREIEGGGDIYLWGSRVQATLTMYRKMRYDAIISLGLPPSLGSGISSTNIGTVRNSGSELTFNVNMIQTAAVGWNMSATVTRNRNLLVSLAQGRELLNPVDETPGRPQTRFVTGYPLFGWWERPILGYRVDHGTPLQAGDVIVGDSVIFLGAQEPNYDLVLNTSATFFNGRLGFNATGSYTNGLTQNRQGQFGLGRFLGLDVNDPNASLGTQAELVASDRTSIGMIQTVNTFRLSSLSVNYQVPTQIARMFRSPHMSVAVQGSNLRLHTNYKGKDPNVNSNVTGNGTADSGQLPLPRQWSFSVNLGN